LSLAGSREKEGIRIADFGQGKNQSIVKERRGEGVQSEEEEKLPANQKGC